MSVAPRPGGGRQAHPGKLQGTMHLVWPARDYLPDYVAALERGWSADNLREEAAAREELARIAADPDAFLASLIDREAAGDPIELPDGTTVPRLPGYRQWMWDGAFCGSIGFRWKPGTEALPPHCLGHIGYSVVPWKRGRGYATQALAELLVQAKAEGLRYVEITTRPENLPSQRVILANGGVLEEEFTALPALGGGRHLRYRVPLQQCAPAIRIRRAGRGDAGAVLACLGLAFEPYRDCYTPGAFADTVLSTETIQHRFDEMAVFVAVSETGEIAGTVGCQTIGSQEGHIRGMAVRPEYLGTGVARSLLEAVETELGQRGCSLLTLDTTEPLERAIRFYERHGFRFSGTVRDFFGMRLLEYSKRLP